MIRTVHQILTGAADLIGRCGWLPDEIGAPATGYSADGALYAAAGMLDAFGAIADPDGPDETATWANLEAAAALLAYAATGHAPRVRRGLSVVAAWSMVDATCRGEVAAALNRAAAVAARPAGRMAVAA